jgi:hypothetical protein
MTATETFWNQIGAYNEATFPMQIVMVIVAVVMTYLVFAKPSTKTSTIMKAFLSFVFAWNLIYFLIFAKSPIATFVGAPLFVIVAILFAADIFTKKIEFKLPDTMWQKYLTIFWILLVFLYPAIGFTLGHYYPKTCTPMMPCPLTVFAIALVTAALPKVDKKVYVFLLLWALMGLPKCLGALECHEDCILFGAGVYGLIMLIRGWKVIGKNHRG